MPTTKNITSNNGLFTYNVTYDNNYNIDSDISEFGDITYAFNTWDSLIKNTLVDGISYDISVNIYITSTWNNEDLDENVLGGASPTNAIYLNNNEFSYPYFSNIFTSRGYLLLNKTKVSGLKDSIQQDGKTRYYHVLLHEIGHILGIGIWWYNYISNLPDSSYNSPVITVTDNSVDSNYYIGQYALQQYKSYLPAVLNNTVIGIPVENDGGNGTAGGHPEEGEEGSNGNYVSLDNRSINNTIHPGLDTELMTGWSENNNKSYLSRITLGFIQDLGLTLRENAYSYVEENYGDYSITIPKYKIENITVEQLDNLFINNANINFNYYSNKQQQQQQQQQEVKPSLHSIEINKEISINIFSRDSNDKLTCICNTNTNTNNTNTNNNNTNSKQFSKNITNINDSVWSLTFIHNENSISITKELVDEVLLDASLNNINWKNVTNLIISNGFQNIHENAFSSQHCKQINSIYLPKSITNISFINNENVNVDPFIGCTQLHSIIVDPSNVGYKDISGVLIEYNNVLNNNILVKYPQKKLNMSYTIPSIITHIQGYSFYNNHHLQTIYLSPNVYNISKNSFYNCNNLYYIYLLMKYVDVFGNNCFGEISHNILLKKVYITQNNVNNLNKYFSKCI